MLFIIRSNILFLIIQLGESEGSDEDGDETKTGDSEKDGSSAKKYVPPRIAPMHYGTVWSLS